MLTPDQIQAIVDRYDESATKVAAALGLTAYQVRNTWHQAKKDRRITKSKAPRPLTADELRTIEDAHKAGVKVAEIAKRLDRPVGTVGCAIHKLQQKKVLAYRYDV
jgi:transposase-like protein